MFIECLIHRKISRSGQNDRQTMYANINFSTFTLRYSYHSSISFRNFLLIFFLHPMHPNGWCMIFPAAHFQWNLHYVILNYRHKSIQLASTWTHALYSMTWIKFSWWLKCNNVEMLRQKCFIVMDVMVKQMVQPIVWAPYIHVSCAHKMYVMCDMHKRNRCVAFIMSLISP